MNVLSITGILPIPEVDRSNDFLIPLYTAYKKKYPGDNVTFFRPVSYKPFSKLNKKLDKLQTYELHGFKITLLPYFSTWRYANMHSFIASYSLFWFNKRKIIRYIKDHAIDVIHAEYIIPDGYLAYLISKYCNKPYLITTHFEFRYFHSAISRKSVLKVLNNASFVTPLNYPSLELYKKYNVKNIYIVPHGIEEPFLNAKPKQNNSVEVKILSVGALIALKNLDKVLYALANLKNKYSFRYTIIGTGDKKDSLMKLVQKLSLDNHIDFIDKIPYSKMPEEMGKNDIFILPSYFESFGRVFFEAMAVGLPIIWAKNTGIDGYFEEGQVGYSVAHNSITDIEDKISLLLGDRNKRIEMGKRAKVLMSKYTWESIISKFHELYNISMK